MSGAVVLEVQPGLDDQMVRSFFGAAIMVQRESVSGPQVDRCPTYSKQESLFHRKLANSHGLEALREATVPTSWRMNGRGVSCHSDLQLGQFRFL
jgi:hypothetical protein